jgi:hypothetical protein
LTFAGLRGVKRELLNALQKCNTNECKQVQKDYEIGRLDESNIHYDKVSWQQLFSFIFHSPSFINAHSLITDLRIEFHHPFHDLLT